MKKTGHAKYAKLFQRLQTSFTLHKLAVLQANQLICMKYYLLLSHSFVKRLYNKIISIIYSAFIYKGHAENLGLKIFLKSVGNKLKVLRFLHLKQSNIMKWNRLRIFKILF